MNSTLYADRLTTTLLMRNLTSALTILILAVLSGSTGATVASNSQTAPTHSQPSLPILLTDPVPDPMQANVQWFAVTGHTLRGAFLNYWDKYGGLTQFGYPVTEGFFEEVGTDHKQLQVQYFERNRFELHPENAGTQYEVLLGTLGREFHQQDSPNMRLPEPASYFPETGHNLSGKFLEYWQNHGGLAVHGYPITEAAMERSTNGKEYLVQWFERSRIELHPENAGTPYEVLLGLLGRQLSEKKGYTFGWYPHYGHASDFSWIAGSLFPVRLCVALECTCALFAYGSGVMNPVFRITQETNARLQPNIPLVFFGKISDATEQLPECRNSKGYLVMRIQENPTR